MARKSVHLKSEELKERQDVADFLNNLADKLEANRLALRQGAKEVSFDIPEYVDLGIEVEEKHKRGQIEHSLEIEINWLEERVKLAPVAPAAPTVRKIKRPNIRAVKNPKAPKVSKATRSAAKTMRKVKNDAARLSSEIKQLTKELAKA